MQRIWSCRQLIIKTALSDVIRLKKKRLDLILGCSPAYQSVENTNALTVDWYIFALRTEFGCRESSSSDKQLLTIYDLDNKFIAYSASFDDVIDVVAEWGSFYILTRDGKMFVLQEKDTQTKLEVRWQYL